MTLQKGQSSLEFLYTVSFMLFIFTLVVVINLQAQQDQRELSGAAEARRICHAVAAQISALAAAGDGTAALLSLPPTISSDNYTVYVVAASRSISVSYAGHGQGCTISTTNVQREGTGVFYINGSTAMRNVNGGVVLG